MTDVPERLRRLIVNRFSKVEYDDITPAMRLTTDLGADSLDLSELVIAIEREFGVSLSIEDETAIETATVGDVVALLQARGAMLV